MTPFPQANEPGRPVSARSAADLRVSEPWPTIAPYKGRGITEIQAVPASGPFNQPLSKHQIPGRNDMRKLMIAAAFALPMFGTVAMAQETLKIGYIDPLSGGGASVGEVGLKTFQFLADEVNAKGGIQGKKVEIVPLDNKTNPQES